MSASLTKDRPVKQAASVAADIAARLAKADAERASIPAIRSELSELDLDTAYAVQEINTKKALADGRRLVGRKIGLTAKTVQTQLGVDQPDFGMLFADMEVDMAGQVPSGRLIQPKVEAEIAFVLDRDLDQEAPSSADVSRAIAYASPALEIVDSRIDNWDIGIVDTVADNASSGLFVLGSDQKSVSDLDLRLCGMVMEEGGIPVSSGAGAACLGNPLNAVRWLAAQMTKLGRPLQAGDIVLSGALGPMVTVQPGQQFEARVNGLGTVSVGFEA